MNAPGVVPAVHDETEHQELLHAGIDPSRPLSIHIPSALAALGYYVWVRVPDAALAGYADARVTIDVGGLTPKRLVLARGDGVVGPARHASRIAGTTWIALCRAFVARGDGTLHIDGLPAGAPRVDLLLCTWPRFVLAGLADDLIGCGADPRWAASGVPLGGIGAGRVEICRDGRFRTFSGNDNQDMPSEDPDGIAGAFIALGVDGDERLLATRPMAGVEPCSVLDHEFAFPQARLSAPGIARDVDCEALFSGPVVPHDLARSALPGFVVRITVANRRAVALRARVRIAWPNLVGEGGGIGAAESRIGYGDGFYRHCDAPAAHTAAVDARAGFTGIRYGNAPNPRCPGADGEHWLLARGAGERGEDPRFGWIARTIDLAPGEARSIDVVIAWAVPRQIDLMGVDRGRAWQTEGGDIATRLCAGFDALITDAGALPRLLRAGTLPRWMSDRLANCCYPLVSNSVLFRDGRFSINEGPTEMGACFGTLDQRLGAHPATHLLFPELERRELEQFARAQAPNGGVNHDLGSGHLEREPGDCPWPDLTCDFVLQLARHAWLAGDDGFAARMWPRARRALIRHGEWADAGGGVAQVGDGLGTSYDGYHYHGTTGYVGTLWLAALAVARRWALRVGDTELPPRIDAWRVAALARLDADLWNGSFYRCYAARDGRRNDRHHAGTLAGQHFARLLAGVDVLPDDRLAGEIEALIALNLDPRHGAPPDEVGTDGSTTDYGWLPYVEAFGLTAAIGCGDARALAAWERVVRVMERDGAGTGDTRLMYRPHDGSPSWGACYMTAPASWLVYEALTGFACEPGEGALRFAPLHDGVWPLVHPRFWALGERRGDAFTLRIERTFGAPVTLRAIAGRSIAAQELRPGTTVTWRGA
ncbi:MAG TPA: GH116 family glycosyl hydrolase [Planctomycetota bacterium]|nr:GH116 family glycosyl hydrolase [Planctomycetota bacterium]